MSSSRKVLPLSKNADLSVPLLSPAASNNGTMEFAEKPAKFVKVAIFGCGDSGKTSMFFVVEERAVNEEETNLRNL
jgi:hypothetical protein